MDNEATRDMLKAALTKAVNDSNEAITTAMLALAKHDGYRDADTDDEPTLHVAYFVEGFSVWTLDY